MYILDKVENNPGQIDGRPVWGEGASSGSISATLTPYRVDSFQRPPTSDECSHQRLLRSKDCFTAPICADSLKGGNVMGNGTWLSIGGNQAVVAGGLAASVQDGSQAPYYNADGRRSYVLSSFR